MLGPLLRARGLAGRGGRPGGRGVGWRGGGAARSQVQPRPGKFPFRPEWGAALLAGSPGASARDPRGRGESSRRFGNSGPVPVGEGTAPRAPPRAPRAPPGGRLQPSPGRPAREALAAPFGKVSRGFSRLRRERRGRGAGREAVSSGGLAVGAGGTPDTRAGTWRSGSPPPRTHTPLHPGFLRVCGPAGGRGRRGPRRGAGLGFCRRPRRWEFPVLCGHCPGSRTREQPRGAGGLVVSTRGSRRNGEVGRWAGHLCDPARGSAGGLFGELFAFRGSLLSDPSDRKTGFLRASAIAAARRGLRESPRGTQPRRYRVFSSFFPFKRVQCSLCFGALGFERV